MAVLKKNKIVVVGAGNVGESVVFSLMLKRVTNEVVMIDLNEDRAEGSAFDIADATAFYHHTIVRKGGYEECADAEIIIITAGIARKPGQTRLDLAKTNVSIIEDITKNIMQHADDPIIIVVSNPVDVLTYIVQKKSGLPATRVIGSGTILDTARLRRLISEKCNISITDVNAYVLGEHGDSQVPIWSRATIGEEDLVGYMKKVDPNVNLDEIADTAKKGGATIIAKKGATFLGIAMCTARIAEAIMKDENAVLSVAHVLGEEYGAWSDVAISLPTIINKSGIVRTMDVPMSDAEKEAMEVSAKTLRDFKNDVMN